MQFLVPIAVLLVLASGVATQCTGNDHPNCPQWKNNGYCTNTAQSMDTRKTYCGVLCGFCNRDGSQTAAGGGSNVTDCVNANANCESWVTTNNFCARSDYSNAIKLQYCCKTCRPILFPSSPTDGNVNCDKWSKNTTNAFCVNANITTTQKTLYCAKTCAFEIKPTADCALYTVTGTELARGTPSKRTAAPGTAVASGAVAGKTTLARVFAATGCTVKLFAAEKPTDTSTGEAQKFGPGKANDNFFPVTPANNGSLSYTCTCV